jgi:predicted permease
VEGSSQANAATGVMTVGAEYFSTIRVQPERGRPFAETDRAGAPLVAVINRSFARRYFHADNPVGRRVRLPEGNMPPPWLNVVGVVPDIVQTDLSSGDADPMLYLPFRQQPRGPMYVLVRTRVLPASLGEACRRALQTIDPDLPAMDIVTLENRLAISRWPLRVFGGILTIFGAIALLLASAGLYAVMAHVVSRRTHEIGVRIALGASHESILRMVLSQGMRPMAIGLAIGLPAAFGITRVMSSLLVGVAPTDPLTFGGAAFVLSTAAIAGCVAPAQRAMRVDPAVALRDE